MAVFVDWDVLAQLPTLPPAQLPAQSLIVTIPVTHSGTAFTPVNAKKRKRFRPSTVTPLNKRIDTPTPSPLTASNSSIPSGVDHDPGVVSDLGHVPSLSVSSQTAQKASW